MKVKLNDSGEVEIYDFNPVEALEVAVKIEEEGINFYTSLTKAVEDDETKNGLQYLLNEEKEHLKFFETQLERARGVAEDGFEEDNIFSYLEPGVFQQFREIKTNSKSVLADPSKAIKLGILVEEDTVKFYRAILKNTGSDEGREAWEKIIDEEVKHKDKLTKILKFREGVIA